jgi:outer membrane protein assembly factor BamE (lipoprotein component of BamABCDE complex)
MYSRSVTYPNNGAGGRSNLLRKEKVVMKTRLSITVIAAAAALSFFAGCSTFNSRARERSATFESLTPTEQQRLKRGMINVGDNVDMVYIALGRPEERRQITTADGTQEMWVYRSYWEQYEGSAWVGWHRWIVPAGRGYVIYHEPVTRDFYSTHAEDRIRVTFDRNGVVQRVEQTNPA